MSRCITSYKLGERLRWIIHNAVAERIMTVMVGCLTPNNFRDPPRLAKSGELGPQRYIFAISMFYHANPLRRLRHGAAFTNTDINPAGSGCLLDTAP